MSFRIIHIISTLHRGGAETVLVNLIKGLRTESDQTVLFFHDGPYRAELEQLGIRCIHIRKPGMYCNPLLWIHLARNIYTYKPQVIHSSLWAANLVGRIIGKLLRIPVVASLHTVREHEGPLRACIERFIPIHGTKTIAASKTIARSMICSGAYRPHELVIIPSGIDHEALATHAQEEPNMPFHKKENSFVIGSVGRLVPVKNFDLLILAFDEIRKKIPHLQLLIIGTGPEEGALRALISKLDLDEQVILITQQTAAPYYKYFDCFVQTSSYEGFGLVLLEALTLRIPVITTSPHEQHEIITHEQTGLVIPPHDHNALINALMRFITDHQLRTRCAAAGREAAITQYQLNHMVQQYRTTFHDASQK